MAAHSRTDSSFWKRLFVIKLKMRAKMINTWKAATGKAMNHPYFGVLHLSRSGKSSKEVIGSLQTTAFYYELIKLADAAPADCRPLFGVNRSVSFLTTKHKISLDEETLYLTLSEEFTHWNDDYHSEIFANGFRIRFENENIMVNYDAVDIVLKGDKVYTFLRKAGKGVADKCLDDVLEGLRGHWEAQKTDLHQYTSD